MLGVAGRNNTQNLHKLRLCFRWRCASLRSKKLYSSSACTTSSASFDVSSPARQLPQRCLIFSTLWPVRSCNGLRYHTCPPPLYRAPTNSLRPIVTLTHSLTPSAFMPTHSLPLTRSLFHTPSRSRSLSLSLSLSRSRSTAREHVSGRSACQQHDRHLPAGWHAGELLHGRKTEHIPGQVAHTWSDHTSSALRTRR
jgi:hypothetical protein